MADTIQADYEQLEQIAQRFMAQAENIGTMRGQIEQTMSPLVYDGGWVGAAADSFQAEMEGVLLPGVERLQEAMAEANRVTLEISRLVREAEEEAAAPFNGGEFVGQPVGGSAGGIGDDGVSIGQPVGGSGGVIGGDGVSIGQPVGGGSPLENGIAPDLPFIGGRDGFVSAPLVFSDEVWQGRDLSPAEQALVTGLGVVALGADTFALAGQTVGAGVQSLFIALDGPAVFGDAAAVALHNLVVKPPETAISLVGAGATALSDIIQGNTYFTETGIAIGQDSVVAASSLTAGLFMPEGYSGTAVNAATWLYGVGSFTGNLPGNTRYELRIEPGIPTTYFVGYPLSE